MDGNLYQCIQKLVVDSCKSCLSLYDLRLFAVVFRILDSANPWTVQETDNIQAQHQIMDRTLVQPRGSQSPSRAAALNAVHGGSSFLPAELGVDPTVLKIILNNLGGL